MQLVPRPGRTGVKIRMAEHTVEHCKLAEQGDARTDQRRFMSIAGDVVGHLLPELGLLHPPATGFGATRMQDNSLSIKPFLIGWDTGRGYPDTAGVAEIGSESLLMTANQILRLDGGQLENGLSQSPATGWTEWDPEPGVDVSPPD